MNQEFYSILEEICREDGRYKHDAYEFVMEALGFTQKKLRFPKHVSGKELLEGIKKLALQKFGPMTLSVFEYWGIRRTEDFGHIVFNLVENKVLNKTEEDSIEDFKDGFDFHETFGVGYRRQMEKKISRMR